MERNARIFNRTEAPSFMVTAKIKDEASMWIIAGAKHLAHLIGRVCLLASMFFLLLLCANSCIVL